MSTPIGLLLTLTADVAAGGDGALAATGTGTATFVGASQADSVLAATGTGTASFEGAFSLGGNADLAATGTGTAAFAGEGNQTDSPFSMTGTGTATFINGSLGEQNAVPGGGHYVHRGSAYWKQYSEQFRRKKKRKKAEALAELDELIVEVQAEPKVDEEEVYREALEAAKGVSLVNTLAQIENEVAQLKALMAEIDDEETILLLM